jgi:DNA-binding response OmpR family regulator
MICAVSLGQAPTFRLHRQRLHDLALAASGRAAWSDTVLEALLARTAPMTKHILIVDDQADLLSLMRMLLEDQQYQVSVLQEGTDALVHVQAHQPDLVILDLKLADVSGFDVLHALKAHASTADVPVIVYSAAIIEAEAVEGLIAHDPGYYAGVSVLQKPFDLDALLDRVHAMLGVTEGLARE